MEELMMKITMLKRSIDIIDANPNERDIVTNQLREISEMVENTKSLVEHYKNTLSKKVKQLEKDKIMMIKMKEYGLRLDYMIENMPQNTEITNDRESRSVLSPINNYDDSCTFNQPKEVSSCIFNQPKEVPKQLKPEKVETLIKSLDKSHISTPEPRKDLRISVSYITNVEYDQVPQYMKGRLKINDVNGFVDIFNTVVNKKEELLQKNKNSLNNKKEMDLWIVWKGQGKGTLSGQYFCTAKDFDTQGGVKLGKREFSIIIILRHVKRIKEVREKGNIYYVACF